MSAAGTVTPWTTATRYATGYPDWVPEADRERIQAYTVYNNMYWSEDRAVDVVRAAEDGQPLYIPKPKMVVDTTSHYLLKGLTITLDGVDEESEEAQTLKAFLDRETFLARFNIGKLKGVTLGDWIFHLTADESKPPENRISLNTVDPAAYFPEFHPDDEETRVGVKLVEPWQDPNDPSKALVKILRYFYDLDDFESGTSLVWREENIWEVHGWNNPKEAKLYKALLPLEPLPASITEIPVYHFKNAEWDGYLFGNSELKGLERVFKGISQAMSDEEIALALVGLGVYATDAGRPTVDGKTVDWVISPGTVLEVPGATMFKKLEGITTVTPVQDHLKYLGDVLMEASGTSEIALGTIDPQVAESGIALSIKFSPTLAKIEYRDQSGLAKLTQLWHDIVVWFREFENIEFTSAIIPKLGEKLPLNRVAFLNELNQLFDRKIISGKFYREECERKLGFTFPEDIETQILDEEKARLEVMQAQMEIRQGSQENENESNNRNRVNESNGTESNDS